MRGVLLQDLTPLSAAKGKPDKAIKIMEKATALEESVSPLQGRRL